MDTKTTAFEMLVAVAKAAHAAMEEGETMEDQRTVLEASAAQALSDALDALDGLPEIADLDRVYDGWARAEYFAQIAAAKPCEAALAQQPAAVEGVDWKAMYRIQTAMRYMDNLPEITRDAAFRMSDEDCARLESQTQGEG